MCISQDYKAARLSGHFFRDGASSVSSGVHSFAIHSEADGSVIMMVAHPDHDVAKNRADILVTFLNNTSTGPGEN